MKTMVINYCKEHSFTMICVVPMLAIIALFFAVEAFIARNDFKVPTSECICSLKYSDHRCIGILTTGAIVSWSSSDCADGMPLSDSVMVRPDDIDGIEFLDLTRDSKWSQATEITIDLHHNIKMFGGWIRDHQYVWIEDYGIIDLSTWFCDAEYLYEAIAHRKNGTATFHKRNNGRWSLYLNVEN